MLGLRLNHVSKWDPWGFLESPTPDQNVDHARTHFRENGAIFQWGANSRSQEKWVILQAWVHEILKKG